MEEWRKVIGFEDYYEVSNLGRVRSLARKVRGRANSIQIKKEKILKSRQWIKDWYCVVSFYVEGINYNYQVHRLVAQTFIPNPENKPYINHKNGIKYDNRVENLEWVTASENIKHSFAIGLSCKKGIKHGRNKFTEEDIHTIRRRLKRGEKGADLAREYGVERSSIYSIQYRKTWNHLKIEEYE